MANPLPDVPLTVATVSEAVPHVMALLHAVASDDDDLSHAVEAALDALASPGADADAVAAFVTGRYPMMVAYARVGNVRQVLRRLTSLGGM